MKLHTYNGKTKGERGRVADVSLTSTSHSSYSNGTVHRFSLAFEGEYEDRLWRRPGVVVDMDLTEAEHLLRQLGEQVAIAKLPRVKRSELRHPDRLGRLVVAERELVISEVNPEIRGSLSISVGGWVIKTPLGTAIATPSWHARSRPNGARRSTTLIVSSTSFPRSEPRSSANEAS